MSIIFMYKKINSIYSKNLFFSKFRKNTIKCLDLFIVIVNFILINKLKTLILFEPSKELSKI